jgi:hypothetical protein
MQSYFQPIFHINTDTEENTAEIQIGMQSKIQHDREKMQS